MGKQPSSKGTTSASHHTNISISNSTTPPIVRANPSISSTQTQPLAKPKLFGNWTGKLPSTLLDEYIRKQQLKISYNFTNFPIGDDPRVSTTERPHESRSDLTSDPSKAKASNMTAAFPTLPTEYQCKITISKIIKDSIEYVTFYPFNQFFASKQEAKHVSATYTLHRLQSNSSLYTLLPPSHRLIWKAYDKVKADSDQDLVLQNYTADPWEAKTKPAEPLPSKTPWTEYPTLSIPKQQRERLEFLIRDNIAEAVSGTVDKTVPPT